MKGVKETFVFKVFLKEALFRSIGSFWAKMVWRLITLDLLGIWICWPPALAPNLYFWPWHEICIYWPWPPMCVKRPWPKIIHLPALVPKVYLPSQAPAIGPGLYLPVQVKILLLSQLLVLLISLSLAPPPPLLLLLLLLSYCYYYYCYYYHC